MSDPAVLIRLDGNGRARQPGETLSGEYRLLAAAPEEVKAVEVSVLWYTEGKGDEDLAIHEFWRLDADSGDCIDASRPERFRTVLPYSPLSYEGKIVKIRWCVRVRAFLAHGKEIVGQQVFRLGCVPPIKIVEKCLGSTLRMEKASVKGGEEVKTVVSLPHSKKSGAANVESASRGI